jgi:hypothetical protein
MELSFVCQYTFLVISSERRNLNPVKYRKVRFDQITELYYLILIFFFCMYTKQLILSKLRRYDYEKFIFLSAGMRIFGIYLMQ